MIGLLSNVLRFSRVEGCYVLKGYLENSFECFLAVECYVWREDHVFFAQKNMAFDEVAQDF